jgi:PAS domain S-box-containing protein
MDLSMVSKSPGRDEDFAAAQRGILESIAFGRPLQEMLRSIVQLIEARSQGMLCSILLLDGDRVRHVAAPSLPNEYIAAIEGEKIGPAAGSCGTAAYTGRPVIVEDIATHPSWAKYNHLALPHGLLACWSVPILAPEGHVLGTFAMYYRERRGPTAQEAEWVEVATHLAYVAILSERARTNEIERLRMEAQMRQDENLRSVILDNIDDAIFYIQVEGEGNYRLLSVNRAFTQICPQASERIVGRMLHEFLPDGLREQILQSAVKAITTSERQRWEISIQAGAKRADVALMPVLDAQGCCTHLVGTLHDISARIDAENERAQMQSKLHQAQRMQALGTLAGGIAHDFNNILAAIGGNAELLLGELSLESSARLYAAEIMRASTRAADLVRQILSFSRSSSPTYEPFDPRAVALEAINLLRLTLPRSVRIEAQFANDAPPILADPSQFHQVLINLVTNAAHAYDGEGVVIVSLDRTMHTEIAKAEGARLDPGVYLRVRVVDTGCGMDAGTLKRAFDPFFTTRAPGEGTGLGLSVVHSIVEKHRGSIEIQSMPAKGTTATVYFPAIEVELHTVASRPASNTRGDNEKIMYVDDEEALVLLMEGSLRNLGYSVRGFTDPAIALGEFSRAPHEFDVVITDLAMPGMTGREFAAKIRELSKSVPIVMTSGYIRDEDREAARQLNITRLVYKSNTIRQLTDALAAEIANLQAGASRRTERRGD